MNSRGPEAPSLRERLARRKRRAGHPQQLGGSRLVGRLGAVEAQHPRVMRLERGHDHERVTTPAFQHAVQMRQRRLGPALVDGVGNVLDQSGGVASPAARSGNTYVIAVGVDITRKALIATSNGTAQPVSAAPCGVSLPGGVPCSPAGSNDGTHVQVAVGAGPGGPFYIAVLG